MHCPCSIQTSCSNWIRDAWMPNILKYNSFSVCHAWAILWWHTVCVVESGSRLEGTKYRHTSSTLSFRLDQCQLWCITLSYTLLSRLSLYDKWQGLRRWAIGFKKTPKRITARIWPPREGTVDLQNHMWVEFPWKKKKGVARGNVWSRGITEE